MEPGFSAPEKRGKRTPLFGPSPRGHVTSMPSRDRSLREMGIRAEIKNEDEGGHQGGVRTTAGTTRLTGWKEKFGVFWNISERGALDSGSFLQRRSSDEWELIWGNSDEGLGSDLAGESL
jgi:hypothetical protein